MSYVYCPKCKSKNISKLGTGYVCNECGNEFPAYQPTPIEAFSDECKEQANSVLSFVKSIDSSNYKSKLLNVKMAFRYTVLAVLIIIVVSAYNMGKGSAVRSEWLSHEAEYRNTIAEYDEAKNKLPELQREIVSNSSLIAEINGYKEARSGKQAELEILAKQVANLTEEKDDLEEQVADLTKEKELLTGEIAKAKGKGYTLTAGKYIGGEDIPTGTYNIIWVSGSGNVFVGRQVNEIFGNNSRYGYIKTYKNAEVDYLTEIEIHGNVKVKFKAKD